MASGGVSYKWTTPQGTSTNPVITATSLGAYTVTVTNSVGCTNATTVTVTASTTPTMNNVFRCNYYPSTFIGFGGRNLTAGNTIEGSNTMSATCNLVLKNNIANLGVNSISIQPNPASDFIAIQSDLLNRDLTVELIDIQGKIIKTNKILQGSTLSIIETDTVYDGIYFVKISDGKESKSFKVIVL